MINLLYAGNYKVFDGILSCSISIMKRIFQLYSILIKHIKLLLSLLIIEISGFYPYLLVIHYINDQFIIIIIQ